MEPLIKQPHSPPKCDACGADKTKSRMIWLNSENGQIYPKVIQVELTFFLVLMGLSLLWFIVTVVHNQNPFQMVVSVVLFLTLTTVNVVQGQRYLSRKKYDETLFFTCQTCGNQWLAPSDQAFSSHE